VVDLSDHYFSEEPKSKKKFGIIKTNINDRYYTFYTVSGIFSSKKIDTGTRILIESMQLPEKGRILDLGCGIGVIGIVAASMNPHLDVIMTDINKRATQISKENVKHHGLKNVKVLTGNLYEPVYNEKFNVIISNPPVSAGIKKVVKKIVAGAPQHLMKGGSLQIVIQWNKGGKTLTRFLKNSFETFEILERKSGYRVFLART
jgi:16S rRNA (guanine1207-N2)-methyltransferase